VNVGGIERLRRIALVVEAANGPDPAQNLAVSSADVLSASGIGLVIVVDDLPSLLSSSNPTAARLEEIQQTLGEGPSLDAHATGRAVGEPYLAHAQAGRWPAFGPAAYAEGAAAIFSFPLRIGGARLGALTLHRSHAGDLHHAEYVDARAVAGIVAHAVIAIQAQAAPGTLGRELATLERSGATLHQASGMVSVQLGVSVGEALVRIRAHAFANDRRLGDIAADVVARRLVFSH
jgi:hypothetical protein